ncbi:MAG: hypothetical protein PHC61_10555, partial [Chitinivibrionales bacterium]|nr:hypothetical protein [Chitinivibrionales bacterium]
IDTLMLRTLRALYPRDTLDTIRILGDSITLRRHPSDTINSQKDKLTLRLYEPSAPWAEKMLHVSNLGYDFSYTTYTSKNMTTAITGDGRVLYGQINIAPIRQITLSGQETYLKNPANSPITQSFAPSVQVQMLDFPPGVELYGDYQINLAEFALADSSTNTVTRDANLILRPGSWWKGLSWMSPRGSINQTITNAFVGARPSTSAVLRGEADPMSRSLSRMAGVYIYPSTDMLFRTENTWGVTENKVLLDSTFLDTVTLSDTTVQHYRNQRTPTFKTFDDFSWWFNDKRDLWQTNYTLTTAGGTVYHHSAYTRFDNVVNSWLTCMQGVASNYDVDTNGKVFKIGPNASVSINRNNTPWFKRFSMTNTLSLYWYSGTGVIKAAAPEVDYYFNVSTTIRPNMEISYINLLTAATDKLTHDWMIANYQGNLTVLVTF